MTPSTSGKTDMAFTLSELAEEARREAKMRRQVYERQGMNALRARRIDMMDEIAKRLEELAKGERLI